ncbi:hypothetical protein BH20VER3_BH20VER3_01140 [soil metagenome]
MKSRCEPIRRKRRSVFRWHVQGILSLLVLSGAFCLLPVALARDPTPAEMIAQGLPSKRTLKNATQSDFLSAVCAAVKKHRAMAAGITSMAVVARRDLAGEIVEMVLRCDDRLTCDFLGPIVAAATAAAGNPAAIVDAAMAKAPTCAETIREAVKRGAVSSDRAATEGVAAENLVPRMDDEFDPREEFKLVCDGKTPRIVRASQLEAFLRSHAGSFLGNCPQAPPPPPAPSAQAVAPASPASAARAATPAPPAPAPRPTQP